MQLYVGTSGWAYKQWQPDFYPPKLAQTKFLNFYSSKLNAVEVNYTFRHLLSEKTINNWLAQTPDSFRFALKANQAITHIKRLKAGVEEPLNRFLSSVGPLASAGRLGPILFQLPPQMKAAPDVLASFLGMLPEDSSSRLRVSARKLVQRRDLCGPAGAQRRVVRCRERGTGHTRGDDSRVWILPASEVRLFGGGTQETGRASARFWGRRSVRVL